MHLGGTISYLRSVCVRSRIFGENYLLSNINRVIDAIEQSERLKITKEARSFRNLKEFKKELEEKGVDLEDKKVNLSLGKDLRSKLFGIMDKLLEVIIAETSTLYVYTLTDKRISVENLMDNIEKCFAKDIFIAIPDSIQYDLKESGKCIATECCTAGAFHVLRGLEALLKLLLQNLDPSIDLTKLKGWDAIINEIKKHNKKHGITDLEVTCDNCDRIRANYRNPTNHPDKIYNIEDVQDLFNLCVGVIDDLVGYIKSKGYL